MKCRLNDDGIALIYGKSHSDLNLVQLLQKLADEQVLKVNLLI